MMMYKIFSFSFIFLTPIFAYILVKFFNLNRFGILFTCIIKTLTFWLTFFYYASGVGLVIKTLRGFVPSAGPMTPAASNSSIKRVARLNPTDKRR